MTTLAIIPARYASTRFPGKPLVDIDGQPMVWRVYEQVLAAGLKEVVVATDDQRIFDAVQQRGGQVLMTSGEHQSGTDRCGEVVQQFLQQGKVYDFVLNIQGDEPYIQPQQIQQLIAGLKQNNITTLAKKITDEKKISSPDIVKVVFSQQTQKALYFSRSPIPYFREANPDVSYYKHIGLYGFDAALLQQLVQLPPSPLEQTEKLEQLRWLEAGHPITVVETEYESKGIDRPEDLL